MFCPLRTCGFTPETQAKCTKTSTGSSVLSVGLLITSILSEGLPHRNSNTLGPKRWSGKPGTATLKKAVAWTLKCISFHVCIPWHKSYCKERIL